MKNLKLLLLAGLCLALCVGIANAGGINIDEDFNDGTPFQNLGRNYANTYVPTSATVKGINICESQYTIWVGTPTATTPATETILTYNPSSANTQGAIYALGTGAGKAWKLSAGQKLLFGQAGKLAGDQESGDGPVGGYNFDGTTTTNMNMLAGGEISCGGGGIEIAQSAVSFHTSSTLGNVGADLGSIKFYFGDNTTSVTHDGTTGAVTNDGIPSTHTLVYQFLSKGDGTVDVKKIKDGGTSATISTITADRWAMITTVWAASTNNGTAAAGDTSQKWGTIPKKYYTGNRGGAWTQSGSADGHLYPNGKGWPTGTRLTSSTLGASVYSFINTNPLGTTSTAAMLVDSPWNYDVTKVSGAKAKLRTWKIQAGPSNALYVDDLYLENDIRNSTLDSGTKQNADYRLHAFDNPFAVSPAGVPVELSVFTLR